MVQLTITPLDWASARAVLHWRYPPPYDVYDFGGSPDELEREALCLLDPDFAYYRITDADRALVGFCCFGIDAQVEGGDYTTPAVDIGLGVRPDLTGRGLGQRFCAAVIDFALVQFDPALLRVTIAVFNRRAHQVWQRAGFRATGSFRDRYLQREFVVFTRPVPLRGQAQSLSPATDLRY